MANLLCSVVAIRMNAAGQDSRQTTTAVLRDDAGHR